MQKKSIFLVIFILFANSVSCIELVFDTLFPLSWHEKAFNSLIFVCNKILDEPSLEHLSLQECDILLGKCIFAHFCLQEMHRKKQCPQSEDSMYFSAMVIALEEQLVSISSAEFEEDGNKDQRACLLSLVGAIKKALQVTCNINTK